MSSKKSNLWNPFDGFVVCVSNPWKIAEYKRILGVEFEYKKRFVTKSGSRSRRDCSISSDVVSMPLVSELLHDRTSICETHESKGQYEDLGRVVALKKALWFYKMVNRPLIVEAVHLCVPGLSGFPGHLTEEMEGNNETLVQMVKDEVCNRGGNKAVAIATLLALSGVEHENPLGVQVRHGVVDGTIVVPDRSGTGFGWDEIFVPDGSPDGKTFQQLGKFDFMVTVLVARMVAYN